MKVKSRSPKEAPRRLEGTDTGDQSKRKNPTKLQEVVQDLMSCRPDAGGGVHNWLFVAALKLHRLLSPEENFSVLSVLVEGCGRLVPESEIWNAIASSGKIARQPGGKPSGTTAGPQWPAVNQAARQEIIKSSTVKLRDLHQSIPGEECDEYRDAEAFIDELFPGNPLLCVGLDSSRFETRPREEFRDRLVKLSLIVPSPMTALTGYTQSDGKESAHTLENTGPRRYLVTEFDPPKWETLTPDDQQQFGDAETYYAAAREEQVAIIWHLRRFAPLTMVLSSGGKSLHAWWFCEEHEEDDLFKFMRYAVSLGADKQLWGRSQFARLPGGWRADKMRRQEVLYFDSCAGKEVAP